MQGYNTRLPGLAIVLAAFLGSSGVHAETAEENYRLYCAQCHGTQGNGRGINDTVGGLAVSPRNHNNAMEMSKLSDAEIRLAIADGGDAVQKSELMPAWEATLSAQEIDDLVLYLRKLCKCVETK